MKQPTNIKRLFLIVLVLLLAVEASAVVGAGEYYIVNNFWGKLLTSNSDRAPRLMAYDSSDDARFLFVAEASGTSGYVKLRHKSTGLYLAASTSNAVAAAMSISGLSTSCSTPTSRVKRIPVPAWVAISIAAALIISMLTRYPSITTRVPVR